MRRRDSDACPEAIDEDPNYNRIFIAFPVERNSGMDTVIGRADQNNARIAISRQSDPLNTNAYSNFSTTMRSRDAALALIGAELKRSFCSSLNFASPAFGFHRPQQCGEILFHIFPAHDRPRRPVGGTIDFKQIDCCGHGGLERAGHRSVVQRVLLNDVCCRCGAIRGADIICGAT